MKRSIRASLIAGTVVAAVASMAIGGVVIYTAARASLMRQFDEELGEDAHMMASAVRMAADGVEPGFDELDMREFAADGKSYLELWVGDSVLYRSPSLHGRELARPASPATGWTRAAWAPRLRACSLRFVPAADPDDPGAAVTRSDAPTVQLELARQTTPVDDMLAKLRALLVSAGLLAGLMAAAVIAGVVRWSLRPLDHLAGEISRLDDRDLSAAVRLPATPVEVEPVVRQLNEMLRRLEAAFRRERAFSADIAHELRTPMAGLRSTIEVAVSRSRSADDYRGTLTDLLQIIERVQSMVESLLYLSQLEAGQVPVERSPVEIEDVARAAWGTLDAPAARRRLAVEWKVAPGTRVTTDPLLLEVAVRNLFDNAVSHANEGGRVTLSITASPPGVRVANTGSAIAQEDVPALMERFARGDPSRSASGLHAGLGLAIVARIAAILSCTLEIRSEVGGEFVVTLGFPLGDAAHHVRA